MIRMHHALGCSICTCENDLEFTGLQLLRRTPFCNPSLWTTSGTPTKGRRPPRTIWFLLNDPEQLVAENQVDEPQDDLALRVTGLWPGEPSFLQPLSTDPKPTTIPDKDLQPIALAVAEQEQVPAQRLTRQSIPDQAEQPFEPLAHIGDSRGQIDPCGWAQSKHGLGPLQKTHQALERIRIKIWMHLDPAPTRQHHGEPTTRFLLARRFPSCQLHRHQTIKTIGRGNSLTPFLPTQFP